MAPVPQLSVMRTRVQDLVLDVDSTDQFATAAQYNERINEWYQWWFANYSEQQIADSTTLSFSNTDVHKTYTPSGNNLLEIVSVTAHSNTQGTNVISRADFAEVLRLQNQHVADNLTSTAEVELPSMYAIVQNGAVSGLATQPPTYEFYPYALPSLTTTFTITATYAPDDLSSDTDLPRCTPAESWIIVRLAAADMAYLSTGDPDAMSMMLRGLPQEIQAAASFQNYERRPNPWKLDKTVG